MPAEKEISALETDSSQEKQPDIINSSHELASYIGSRLAEAAAGGEEVSLEAILDELTPKDSVEKTIAPRLVISNESERQEVIEEAVALAIRNGSINGERNLGHALGVIEKRKDVPRVYDFTSAYLAEAIETGVFEKPENKALKNRAIEFFVDSRNCDEFGAESLAVALANGFIEQSLQENILGTIFYKGDRRVAYPLAKALPNLNSEEMVTGALNTITAKMEMGEPAPSDVAVTYALVEAIANNPKIRDPKNSEKVLSLLDKYSDEGTVRAFIDNLEKMNGSGVVESDPHFYENMYRLFGDKGNDNTAALLFKARHEGNVRSEDTAWFWETIGATASQERKKGLEVLLEGRALDPEERVMVVKALGTEEKQGKRYKGNKRVLEGNQGVGPERISSIV